MNRSQSTATRPTEVPNHKSRRSSNRQDGAALVEFAMVLPLLLALLFGLIEMSWAFAQLNDIRYGAREGARTYAVEVDSVDAIGAAVCDRMDIVSPSQNVDVILTPDGSYAEGSVGALATVTVTADLQTITGFYDFLLAGKTISSTVEFRIEQPSGGSESVWWTEAASGADTSFDCP